MATYRGQEIDEVEYNRRSETYALISPAGEIVAELKRHELHSQPQLKQVRHTSGKHRRARSAFYSYTSGQSGGTGQAGAFVFSGTLLTWTSSANSKPIPHAGIRAGEVIAYRGWAVKKGGRLFSIYKHEHEWLPDRPMMGDTRNEYGVHAFKTVEATREYAECYSTGVMWGTVSIIMLPNGDLSFKNNTSTYAIGTVALWGEVVEHEDGYRAEFAKILTIDSVIGPADDGTLDALRTRYSLSRPQSGGPDA